LLLEPKLGAAASPNSGPSSGSASGALNWKSYRWAMSSVWLENVLTKQPARWLPPGYSDYGSLLTAAVENAVKQTEAASGGCRESSSDLGQWMWGKNYPVKSIISYSASFR
jgi:penicillin amidase